MAEERRNPLHLMLLSSLVLAVIAWALFAFGLINK